MIRSLVLFCFFSMPHLYAPAMRLHTLPHLPRPTVNDIPPHEREKVSFVYVCVLRDRQDWNLCRVG